MHMIPGIEAMAAFPVLYAAVQCDHRTFFQTFPLSFRPSPPLFSDENKSRRNKTTPTTCLYY
jgi:hypothetical protein